MRAILVCQCLCEYYFVTYFSSLFFYDVYTEGMDFYFVNGPPVVIAAGTSRGCLQISIIPSPLVEPTEEINLAINTTTALAVLEDFVQTTVFILSDGGIYMLF